MMDKTARDAREVLRRFAIATGCTIHEPPARDVFGERTYDLKMEAPRGFHFAEGIHEVISEINRGPWSYAEPWQDIYDRVAGTDFEPCDDGCEWWSDDRIEVTP